MTMPTAPRTGPAAIEQARSRVGGSMAASGYCLQFTREVYGVPAVYASARDAGLACQGPHRGDRNPPPGTPVWFLTSSVYDHVCFYVGPDEVISTFNADIRTFRGISDIERQFQGTYAGWGEDLNTYQVLTGGPTPPPPPEEDDEMPWFIRRADGAIAIVTPTGVRHCTPAWWETYGNLNANKIPPGMDNLSDGPFGALIESLGGWVD